MSEYKDGGLLSMAINTTKRDYAAVCDRCLTVFVDDVCVHGSICCPNCKAEGQCLRRGLTFLEARQMLGK